MTRSLIILVIFFAPVTAFAKGKIKIEEYVPEGPALPAFVENMTDDEFYKWASGTNEKSEAECQQRQVVYQNSRTNAPITAIAHSDSGSRTTTGNPMAGGMGGGFGGGGFGMANYGSAIGVYANAGPSAFANSGPEGGYGGGYFGRNSTEMDFNNSSLDYQFSYPDPEAWGGGILYIINPYVPPSMLRRN